MIALTIPEAVKIGGLKYKVTETEALTLGNDYDGEIIYRELKINLRPTARAKMERTLIHEILHGIYTDLGYTDHDEKKIDELAGALYRLITDNAPMFAEMSVQHENSRTL